MEGLKDLVIPHELPRAVWLIHRIERAHMAKTAALEKENKRAYGVFYTIQEKARVELQEIFGRKREQERFNREHNSVRWIVQDLQRRGLNAEIVARAHMIPLEEVKR